MTTPEVIYAIATALAMVGGFVFEWRRGGALEHRVAVLEGLGLGERVAALEAIIDRQRRAY